MLTWSEIVSIQNVEQFLGKIRIQLEIYQHLNLYVEANKERDW